jgi:hypothetical protein
VFTVLAYNPLALSAFLRGFLLHPGFSNLHTNHFLPAAHFSTMSDSSEKPWSDNPNAPQIPYLLYFAEKANFAGILIGAILYGMSTHVHIFYPSLPPLFDLPFQGSSSSCSSNV